MDPYLNRANAMTHNGRPRGGTQTGIKRRVAAHGYEPRMINGTGEQTGAPSSNANNFNQIPVGFRWLETISAYLRMRGCNSSRPLPIHSLMKFNFDSDVLHAPCHGFELRAYARSANERRNNHRRKIPRIGFTTPRRTRSSSV